MTRVRTATVDPLKQAPSLGAVLALQGVHRALPLLHSAQGCAFLEKVLAIRHFNEPIALATSKLFTEDVVLAAEDAAAQAALTAGAASEPDILALVSTALTEVKGDDVAAAARQAADAAAAVIAVRAPDYEGGLEAGWLAAVRALVALAEPPAEGASHDPRRIAVLAGSHLTPGDVRELRSLIEAFGLEPAFVPDMSALDGSRAGLSALAEGGVTLDQLTALGSCEHALVVGSSLEPAARDLRERCAVPYTMIDSSCGLEATDRLIAQLVLLSGSFVPASLERDRAVLVDAMRDAHLSFAGSHITVALEPDHAAGIAALLDELAASDVTVIVPTASPQASRIATSEVVIGDFGCVPADTDLLVSGSHGERTARVLGAAHIELGFPVSETYGAARRTTVGYRGATALVDGVASALTRHRKEHCS